MKQTDRKQNNRRRDSEREERSSVLQRFTDSLCINNVRRERRSRRSDGKETKEKGAEIEKGPR